MTVVRTYEIPGLATVSLDARDNQHPLLEIRLDHAYHGDLNDIARTTSGPDDVYLSCNETSAINSPELAKFMEVMTHWDYTGDGVPDCDEIIDAIEDAMWCSRDKPEEFHRPDNGWYTKMVMSIMPPAPDRHIIFSFGNLKPRFRWYHHLAALPMLGMIIGLIILQEHLAHWTVYSVITGFVAIAKLLGISSGLALVIFVVGLTLFRRWAKPSRGPSHSQHTYGFFSKAAVYEEQAFREGSEHWSLWQRIRSCLAFGAIHMVNLFYPLATILPLALGGGLFMLVYLRTYRRVPFRRTAVLNSAVWHRVYNRMALLSLAVTLVYFLGVQLIGVIAAAAIILGMAILQTHIEIRRSCAEDSVQEEPVQPVAATK